MERVARLFEWWRMWCERNRRFLPLVMALVAMAAILPSLWAGLSLDDHYFVLAFKGFPSVPQLKCSPLDLFGFGGGGPPKNRIRMEYGVPWWCDEHWQIAFWRPLTSLTHWVDWLVARDRVWVWHLHNLLAYGALAFAATLLYRRLLPVAGIAGLAALLYAIDGAHGNPAGWIANRNGVLAALFMVLVLYFHDRWRRDEWAPGFPLALLSLGLGLLSAEAATAVGGYLFAYAILLDRRRGWRGIAALLPYLAVVGVWQAAYRFLEYGALGSQLYTDPGRDPRAFLMKLPSRIAILLFSQLGAGEAMLWNYLPPVVAGLYLAVAVLFLLFVAWTLMPLLVQSPVARFWALGMVLCVVPSCAAYPQSRLLFAAGIGGMGLVAQFVAWRLSSDASAGESPLRRRAAAALLAVWLFLHVAVSAVSAPIASSSSRFVETSVCRDLEIVPATPEIRKQTVVVVNGVIDLWGIFLSAIRASESRPIPYRCYELAAGNRRLAVERIDDRTLVLRPDADFLNNAFTQVFRNPAEHPMRAGDRVRLDRLEVETTAVTSDGRPKEARCRFDTPLEDPSFRWIVYQGGHYESFVVPPVGSTVYVTNPGFYDILRSYLLRPSRQ